MSNKVCLTFTIMRHTYSTQNQVIKYWSITEETVRYYILFIS